MRLVVNGFGRIHRPNPVPADLEWKTGTVAFGCSGSLSSSNAFDLINGIKKHLALFWAVKLNVDHPDLSFETRSLWADLVCNDLVHPVGDIKRGEWLLVCARLSIATVQRHHATAELDPVRFPPETLETRKPPEHGQTGAVDSLPNTAEASAMAKAQLPGCTEGLLAPLASEDAARK